MNVFFIFAETAGIALAIIGAVNHESINFSGGLFIYFCARLLAEIVNTKAS